MNGGRMKGNKEKQRNHVKTLKNKSLLLTLMAMGALFTACGQNGFSPQQLQNELNQQQQVIDQVGNDANNSMSDIDNAVSDVNSTLSDANGLLGQLDSISNSDAFEQVGSQIQNLSIFQIGKIKSIIENGLTPVIGNVSNVKEAIDAIKLKIQIQLDALNPNDPQQAVLISKLNEILSKVQGFEDKVKVIVAKLLDKVNVIDVLFNGIAAKLAIASIWLIPLKFVLDGVRDYVKQKIRSKLVDLLQKMGVPV